MAASVRRARDGSIPANLPTMGETDAIRDQHTAAFEAAWHDLATHCNDTIAPEATYQAWLAHFTITRLSPLHVVREVDFGARYLGPAAAPHFKPSGNLMVDLLVLREPIVSLPRRAALGAKNLPDGTPNPRSGLGRLGDFTVITELKVSATQIGGLGHTAVVKDFRKLSRILDAAERNYPRNPLPAAYVGVFANRDKPAFDFNRLRRRLAEADIRPDIRMAAFEAHTGQVIIGSAR